MSQSVNLEPTKKPRQQTPYTRTQIKELLLCAQDPLYFMRKFMKVQHPLKGAIAFIPFPYQERIIRAFHHHHWTVVLTGRQQGKTTCAAGYLLWKALFCDDTQILITANKFVQALEVMDRIKFVYENLPDYIRAGINDYNKSTISFDNGSKITARATSADAGRGLSITLLYCDEFAFVPPNKQKEFWTSITPTLSTGGACILTSTPKNDEDQFAIIYKGALETNDDFGNPNETGVGRNGFFAVKSPWWEHPERDENWAKTFREALGEARFRQEFACVTGDTQITVRGPDGLIERLSIDEMIARSKA